MSTSGGTQTTIQKSDPPSWAVPYLQSGLGMAENLYANNSPNYVPTVSDTTRQAQDLVKQRALEGSGAVNAGQNFIESGLSRPASPIYQQAGENPYALQPNMFGSASNPYLDATFNKAALATQNQLASEFARGGRNVGASQGLRAQQLNDLATNIYGGDYANERNRQLQYQQQLTGIGATGIENERNRLMQSGESAADRQQGLLGYGIPYGSQDYTDLQQLASVGGAQDRYGDAINAIPGQMVDDYIRRVTGQIGGYGTSTSSTPMYRNPLTGAVGGAMAGSSFGLPGIIGGGLLGGIFG